VTFEDAPELHEHVAEYQRALDALPGLNPVPVDWLHLTVQGVGYTDETPPEVVHDVAEAVRAEVGSLTPFDLTFGAPIIFGEAIAIRPEPAEPLQALLLAIRRGIAAVRG
jgi:2'-5' RNA ligase